MEALRTLSEISKGDFSYQSMRELTGPMKEDKLIFFICMVFCCMLGVIFRRRLCSISTKPYIRHVYSITFGCLIIFLCYGNKILHLFLISSVVYLFLRTLSRNRAFISTLIFCMTYMSYAHIKRMIVDYGGFNADISLPIMVLVQRLTMLAANLVDGEFLTKSEDAKENGDCGEKANPKSKTLSQMQQMGAVRKTPGVLEYFSYCINFQTVLIGPPLSYNEYRIYIEGNEMEYLKTEAEVTYFKENRKCIIFPKRLIFNCLIRATGFLLMYVAICPSCAPQFYVGEEFASYCLPKKIGYLMLTSCCLRQHYYFAWSFGSVVCLISGLGFNGFNDGLEPQYGLAESFRFKKVEFPTSVKELTDNWNVHTLRWLRVTVFERSPRKFAAIIVFAFSSIWHGFYPGYYLFFISMFWYSLVSRSFRRQIRPAILSHLPDTKWKQLDGKISTTDGSSKIYDLITRIFTYFLVNYTSLAFVLLSFQDCLTAWSQFWFLGHMVCAGLQIALWFHKKSKETSKADMDKKST